MIDPPRPRRHNGAVLGRATDLSRLARVSGRRPGARGWTVPVALAVLATVITAGATAADYEIGPGDVLKVVVLGQAEMTGSFTVGPEGMVSFPILGKVKASENTTLELERKLTILLADGILKRPQVTVTVAEYGSQKVFVTGEVQRPGQYALKADRTLLALLGDVGALGPNVGHEVIVVRPPAGSADGERPRRAAEPDGRARGAGRAGETPSTRRRPRGPSRPPPPSGIPGLPFVAPGSEVFRISLLELQSGNPEKNITLRAGDTVYFPRAAQVYVMGSVARPGPYRFQEGMTRAAGAHARGGRDGARLGGSDQGHPHRRTGRRSRRRRRPPTSSCPRTRSSCPSGSSDARRTLARGAPLDAFGGG